MTTFPSLSALGPRICILGPSNSGKSTLSVAISRKTGLPIVHLDQLHHLPNTHWVPREPSEFEKLYKKALAEEKWIMEGNYMQCFDDRLSRATGIIQLDISTPLSLFRYIRRCLSNTTRHGGLEGGSDRISLDMLKYITVETPPKRKENRERFEQITLPKAWLDSPQKLKAAYAEWLL